MNQNDKVREVANSLIALKRELGSKDGRPRVWIPTRTGYELDVALKDMLFDFIRAFALDDIAIVEEARQLVRKCDAVCVVINSTKHQAELYAPISAPLK